jgi:hypothetical protein
MVILDKIASSAESVADPHRGSGFRSGFPLRFKSRSGPDFSRLGRTGSDPNPTSHFDADSFVFFSFVDQDLHQRYGNLQHLTALQTLNGSRLSLYDSIVSLRGSETGGFILSL